MDKLKSILAKMTSKILTEGRRTRKVKSSMRIVWFYGIGLALVSMLFIGAWCHQWIITGNPNLPLLVAYFKEYTAASVVAAVTFLSVFNIDKNGDGRPDVAEARVVKEQETTKND
jgi:uncharacterized membrane protein